MRTNAWQLLLLSMLALTARGQTADDRMMPIENYLLDESFERALAESAAPVNVGRKATLLVFRRDGSYQQVRRGENGFTCLVERSWSSALVPARPTIDFWNPKMLVPICLNDEAVRTVFQEYLRRTELALAGSNRAEMKRAIDADFAEGRLRPPSGFAMSYMMSAGQMLGTHVGHYRPHVMLYVPYTTNEDLGGNSFESGHPIMFEHEGGIFATVIVPVADFIPVGEHD